MKHSQNRSSGRDLQRQSGDGPKSKEFQAAVAAAGVKLGGNVAKMKVREAESDFS
jgi:hypothetical protein